MAGRRVSAPAARAVRASVRVAAVARCALWQRRGIARVCPLIPAARPRARPAPAATSRPSTTTGCARTRPSWPSASWAGPVRALHAPARARSRSRHTPRTSAVQHPRLGLRRQVALRPAHGIYRLQPGPLLRRTPLCAYSPATRAAAALALRTHAARRPAAQAGHTAALRAAPAPHRPAKACNGCARSSSLSPIAETVGLRRLLTPGGRRRTSRPRRRWTTSSGCT